jgi:hypothetical protein
MARKKLTNEQRFKKDKTFLVQPVGGGVCAIQATARILEAYKAGDERVELRTVMGISVPMLKREFESHDS